MHLLVISKQKVIFTAVRNSDIARSQEVTMGKEPLIHLAYVDCKKVRHDKARLNSSLVDSAVIDESSGGL
jgi:hypothetical protein